MRRRSVRPGSQTILSAAGAAQAIRRAPNARIIAVKVDILENLSDPELTETAVAFRQRVTSRYIRMLFEAEGTTFSKFVLSHRLTHARRMLSDPRFADKSITAVALAAGFGDLSYFDRTFRRLFQASPSEVRTIFVGEETQKLIGLSSLIGIADCDFILRLGSSVT